MLELFRSVLFRFEGSFPGVDNGDSEGESITAGGLQLHGAVSGLGGFTKGAIPQPD